MTLEVWTARLDYGGEDRLDITRANETMEFARRVRDRGMGGGAIGGPFAPSWRIVNDAKRGFKRAKHLRQRGHQQKSDALDAAVWRRYRDEYITEMRWSYARLHHREWVELLERPRVTLVCYCVNPHRCHRSILANILEQLGAVNHGEVKSGQTSLFEGRHDA